MSEFTSEMKDLLSRIIGATPQPDGRFRKMCLAVDEVFGQADPGNVAALEAGQTALLDKLRDVFPGAQLAQAARVVEEVTGSYTLPSRRLRKQQKPRLGKGSLFAGFF